MIPGVDHGRTVCSSCHGKADWLRGRAAGSGVGIKKDICMRDLPARRKSGGDCQGPVLPKTATGADEADEIHICWNLVDVRDGGINNWSIHCERGVGRVNPGVETVDDCLLRSGWSAGDISGSARLRKVVVDL